MVSEVTIPVMDQTTETVTLSGWLKRQGDAVKQGDVLCEIETEKATVEIEAPADGIVRQVFIEKGAQIPPKTVVALIGNADEALPQIDPFYRTTRAKAAVQPAMQPAAATVQPTAPHAAAGRPGKVVASPRARKLAEENGIDIATVTGTGPDGRILEDDVKLAMTNKGQSKAQRSSNAKAERVSQAWQTIPHFYMTITADLSRIVDAKNKAGKGVTYTDYFVVALAIVLAKHPQLNGYWKDNAQVIVPELRIGLVVQTERGLLIPALRDARGRSLPEIATERAKIVSEAMDGKVSGAATAEPTFTVSNVGAGSIDSFTAIISPPQLAILAVGSVMPRPVVVGTSLEVRPTASFTLGVDHRAIDGRQAAAFLEDLKHELERAN